MSAPLLGEDELKRIAQLALRHAKGDQAQATVSARTIQLTRFANNAIHQNVASREATLQVRVVKGRRVSTIRTSDVGEDGIARAAASASELADRVPENPVFAGLPGARPIPPAPSAYVERTAAATPLDRARLAETVCRASQARGFRTAGYVSTNVTELAIASTEGVWAYAPQTLAKAECVVMGGAGSAWAERTSLDVARVDVAAVAAEAVAKCAAAQEPRDMAPGAYEVVLEPYAVSDIVSFLGGALSGQAVEEGRSFVGGRIGERVTGDVTIVDDPLDPEGMPRAFDFDGQPAQALTLVERGVARAVVYDWQTAARTGNASTGHALPPNPFQSCAPMHLRLEAGASTREELIRGVKRGVLVTRFHYTRWVHQLRTIVTGMTRDGTFAIEDGEVAHPVKNFRFSQSYHEALGGTLGIGRDLHLFGGAEFEIGGARRVPALRLASFAFTGGDEVLMAVTKRAAPGTATARPTVAILDYGSQYTQLIARRVRESRVYCEIFPHDVTPAELEAKRVVGVILSGGPSSVYEPDAPGVDPAIVGGRWPVLGICYGMQLMAHVLGGDVGPEGSREYGPAMVEIGEHGGLFEGLAPSERAWMSHGDSVRRLPAGFHGVARTERLPVAAMSDGRARFGVQFHPEVVHTPRGAEVLRNFLYRVVGVTGDWTPAAFVEEAVAEIRRELGDRHAICALSGGVDSAVAATLVARAIGERLTCVFIDTGLLREGEAEQVVATFGPRLRLVAVDAADRFLARLAGVADPEEKRAVIGEEFVRCFEAEAAARLPAETVAGRRPVLVQGTIYPDVIESRSRESKTSARIKTHHNVGGLPEVMALEVLEPLRRLFKDEVRRVGAELGIPEDILWRHPFPGPGLAVRVVGEIDREKLGILRKADAILIEELRAADLYRKIAQAFAVLTPVRSVGVQGDFRTYGYLVALRAVTTDDFMTADWARLPYDVLERISARIVNEVPSVNRVVYDVSSKPPATIEWE